MKSVRLHPITSCRTHRGDDAQNQAPTNSSDEHEYEPEKDVDRSR